MHDAFPSTLNLRKRVPQVALDQRPTHQKFLKTVCNNPDCWSNPPSRPLDVRRQTHTSTVRTRRKKGADDSRHDRGGYAVWNC